MYSRPRFTTNPIGIWKKCRNTAQKKKKAALAALDEYVTQHQIESSVSWEGSEIIIRDPEADRPAAAKCGVRRYGLLQPILPGQQLLSADHPGQQPGHLPGVYVPVWAIPAAIRAQGRKKKRSDGMGWRTSASGRTLVRRLGESGRSAKSPPAASVLLQQGALPCLKKREWGADRSRSQGTGPFFVWVA